MYICAGFQKFELLYAENKLTDRVEIRYTSKLHSNLFLVVGIFVNIFAVQILGNFYLFEKGRFFSKFYKILVLEPNRSS